MPLVNETVDWIDPSNTTYHLTDQNPYFIPYPGLDSLYGALIEVQSHAVPYLPGDREDYIYSKPNELRFPLWIFGGTQDVVDVNRRTLLEATRPSRGISALRHTANDGTVRDLFVRETGRLRAIGQRTPGALLVGMVVRAADPYWYDSTPTTVALTPTLSSVSSFGLTNLGQTDAWPIYTFTGPMVNPTLTNAATGDTLMITITLTVGQVLTINTDPTILSAKREDGSNQWSTILGISLLPNLIPGANPMVLSIASGITAATGFSSTWKNRWEGV